MLSEEDWNRCEREPAKEGKIRGGNSWIINAMQNNTQLTAYFRFSISNLQHHEYAQPKRA